jgi:hypothetical protein
MSVPGRSVALSVIVVSDYEPTQQKTWQTERLSLHALAAQDIAEPFEVLLVENQEFEGSLPEDLRKICPGLKVVFTHELRSHRLKDHAVGHTAGELVAVLEADCLPVPTWLRVLTAALREHPDVSAASGPTTYGDGTAFQRVLSVLDRGFEDLGRPRLTPHVSNNAALYRRSLLEAFPYPEAVTPFATARLRVQGMRRAGHRFSFEPRAVTRHALGGWDFVKDFRRNTGHADMAMHQRMRWALIPRLLLRRLQSEWADCRRVGSRYLRWHDWPLALSLLIAVRFFEIPGMLDAIRNRSRLPYTAYR